MRYSTFVAGLLVALLSIPTMGCSKHHKTDAQEVQEQTQALLDTLARYSENKKDQAVDEVKKALEPLDERINALEARVNENWHKLSKKAKHETRENLKRLRKERNEVAQWYGGMINSSEDAWGHVKNGFSGAYKDLYRAWERSEEAFEQSQ